MSVKQITVKVFVCEGRSILPDRQILECKELLRPDEVADILRITRRKVYNMVYEGALESVKLPGTGALRVRSRSVLAILDEGSP